jgi:hypothetical protein
MILTIASVGVVTYVFGHGVRSCGEFSPISNPSQSGLVQLKGNTILLIADYQPTYGIVTNLGPLNSCTIIAPEFILKDPSNQTAVKLVEDWIEGFGVAQVTFSTCCGLPSVQANMMVGQAEAMLNVQFNVYRWGGMTFWSNSADPWVPGTVAPALSGIWNLDNCSYEIVAST